MTDRRGIHAELSSLQAELGRGSRHRTDAPPAGGREEAAEASGLEEQLRELGNALSEFAESAEETIMDHPIPAVLAAFVLGIALGRLTGRG